MEVRYSVNPNDVKRFTTNELRDEFLIQGLFQTDIHLSRIENGHKNITFGTLVELCSAYGITLRDFFDELEYDKSGTDK